MKKLIFLIFLIALSTSVFASREGAKKYLLSYYRNLNVFLTVQKEESFGTKLKNYKFTGTYRTVKNKKGTFVEIVQEDANGNYHISLNRELLD